MIPNRLRPSRYAARWLFAWSATIGLGVVAQVAWACPPAVRLGGDPEVVAQVTPLLEERGISTAAGECPAVAVLVQRRGRVTLVSPSPAEGPAVAREVTDVRTVVTVIESLVRTDLEAPLLER